MASIRTPDDQPGSQGGLAGSRDHRNDHSCDSWSAKRGLVHRYVPCSPPPTRWSRSHSASKTWGCPLPGHAVHGPARRHTARGAAWIPHRALTTYWTGRELELTDESPLPRHTTPSVCRRRRLAGYGHCTPGNSRFDPRSDDRPSGGRAATGSPERCSSRSAMPARLERCCGGSYPARPVLRRPPAGVSRFSHW